jgi:tRNA wybutosine-synthesizing protein 1
VQAPNKEVYEKVTRPKIPHAWENFLEFLDVFSKLNTRRVFRLTLIKGLNLVDAKGYAELIKRGNPDYVEVKGFVFVGGARNQSRGLSYGLMPNKEEIVNFAKEMAEASGYVFTDYHEPSNVALLSRNEEVASMRLIQFEK